MPFLGGKEEKGTWLLLKHFPKWLTAADKESLLAHFGATQVVVMAPEGKMVRTRLILGLMYRGLICGWSMALQGVPYKILSR